MFRDFKNDEAAYPNPLGDEGHGSATAVSKALGEHVVCTTADTPGTLSELRAPTKLFCCRSFSEAPEIENALVDDKKRDAPASVAKAAAA